MPEGSTDEVILISISWQALQRARKGDERTMIANCTVALGFMGFYIEASLNHIIDKMNMMTVLKSYFPKKNYLGVQDKFVWFYYRYIAEYKTHNENQFRRKLKTIRKKLFTRFPDFWSIYEFRNKISHGVIDPSIANLEKVEELRKQAKKIVDDLYKIAQNEGNQIPRNVSYDEAIGFKSSYTLDDLQKLRPDESS